MGSRLTIAFALFLGAAVTEASEAQAGDLRIFTQEQLDAGRSDFLESCLSCHKSGSALAAGPSLIGKQFVGRWGEKSVADLYNYIQHAMPPCAIGSLPDSEYINVVAFVLWMNGAKAGLAELGSDSTAKVVDAMPAGAQKDAVGTVQSPNRSSR